MLQITLKEYLIFLGGALVMYYLYIALAYYRKELTGLFRGTGSPGSPQPPPSIDPNATPDPLPKKKMWQMYEVPADLPSYRVNMEDPLGGAPSRDMAPPSLVYEEEALPLEALEEGFDEQDQEVTPEMEALQHIVNVIRDQFLALEVPPNKTALLEKIRNELHAYPDLNVQPYRIAIHNLISSEARERFGLTITEGELETIWPTVTD